MPYPFSQSHQLLAQYFIKPSIQRTVVMDYLLKNRTHPTIDEIYSALRPAMPTLSKTTIYNTLNLFVERGVVRSLAIDEKNARYDIDISSHAHFICKKCGHVIDVFNLNKELFETPEIQDLEIESFEISYRGTCKSCVY